MLRVTLWHDPEYFSFHIRDPISRERLGAIGAELLVRNGYALGETCIQIRMQSEFSKVPITVEYDSDCLQLTDAEHWDRIIEAPIRSKGGGFSFDSATGEPFGSLEVPIGMYGIRVYFGGQNSKKESGESSDYYLIQIWPDENVMERLCK